MTLLIGSVTKESQNRGVRIRDVCRSDGWVKCEWNTNRLISELDDIT